MTESEDKEIERFSEQARWLIDSHEGRSASFCSRATALLGFTGVILALLLRSSPPKGVSVDWLTTVLFCATIILLLATAWYSVQTIKVQEGQVPGTEQLRKNWRDWMKADRRGMAAMDITENFLSAKDPNEDSVVEKAKRVANVRAVHFRRALNAIGLSLVSLTLLLFVIAVQRLV